MKPIYSMWHYLGKPQKNGEMILRRVHCQKKKGNIRDEATIEQLVILSNIESINAMLIHQNLEQAERLEKLNAIAITQMKSLLNNKSMEKLM